jgi:hypothetical protein
MLFENEDIPDFSGSLIASLFFLADALTEVVVAEIVAGPHALDSCECMNIEGQILRKT